MGTTQQEAGAYREGLRVSGRLASTDRKLRDLTRTLYEQGEGSDQALFALLTAQKELDDFPGHVTAAYGGLRLEGGRAAVDPDTYLDGAFDQRDREAESRAAKAWAIDQELLGELKKIRDETGGNSRIGREAIEGLRKTSEAKASELSGPEARYGGLVLHETGATLDAEHYLTAVWPEHSERSVRRPQGSSERIDELLRRYQAARRHDRVQAGVGAVREMSQTLDLVMTGIGGDPLKMLQKTLTNAERLMQRLNQRRQTESAMAELGQAIQKEAADLDPPAAAPRR